MSVAPRRLNHDDYTVGWICALPETELSAALAMLDEKHPYLPAADPKDANAYVLGKIGDHNVVIACLPAETTGKVSAATVAKDLVRSFNGVRVGLMVGVGGGAPLFKVKGNSDTEDSDSEEDDSEYVRDIRLGDIVVSQHKKGTAAVLQYDFGKSVQGKEFIRIGGELTKPPGILLSAVSVLRSENAEQGQKISQRVTEIRSRNPHKAKKFECPGPVKDKLFKSAVLHVDVRKSCKACCGPLDINLIKRKAREDSTSRIHYGTIGSADQVMKDAGLRDKWAEKEKIMCFEMEAA